jgi:flagellar motor switch protein FliM
MTDVLSPDEIAQLFAAAKDGNLPEGPRKPERLRSIRKFDFSRPMKLSLLEQRRFERAHESFCRDTSERLTSELRSPVELEVINSAQLTWQAALEDVPQPSILGVAACAPGQAMIVICVEEALVLRMIDRLLGGSLTDTPASRTLTEIDTELASHILEGLAGALSTTWQELLGLSVSFEVFDLHNTPLEYMPSIQPTLELTIEARDQIASSTILVLVPHTAIEAATRSLDNDASAADGRESDDEAATSMRGALGCAAVEVRAELGAVDLTIGEVLSLCEGDVVALGSAGDVAVRVGEERLLAARPGLSGNRRAVKIVHATGGRS